MDVKLFFIYLLIVAGTTYLIRVIPFNLIRNKIKNKFVQSFLYYIPYTVLSAMTLPACIYATGNIYSGISGSIVASIFAFKEKSITLVAFSASITALIVDLLFMLF